MGHRTRWVAGPTGLPSNTIRVQVVPLRYLSELTCASLERVARSGLSWGELQLRGLQRDMV